MSGRRNYERARREDQERRGARDEARAERATRQARLATPKQMKLWRDLALELRLPPPPSQALFVEATRNIDRLLRLKGRPIR